MPKTIVEFAVSAPKSPNAFIIPVFQGTVPDISCYKDQNFPEVYIKSVLKAKKSFEGKSGQFLSLHMADKNQSYTLIFMGLGDPEKNSGHDYEELGGKLYGRLKSEQFENAAFLIDADTIQNAEDPENSIIALATGFKLASYNFDRYKSGADKGDEQSEVRPAVTFISNNSKDLKKRYSIADIRTDGIFFARDLVNEPANVLTPAEFAKRVRDLLEPLGVEVTILNEKEMAKNKMEAFLNVGKASDNEPCLVLLHWRGDKKQTEGKKKKPSVPIALVGKGITFDSGGISIKPGAGMDEMKMDMGGAGTVAGVFYCLAKRKAKGEVLGALALAENMISGAAYRPGDILKSMSGQTIEVLNTDAEGRLVLADTFTYIQKHYSPAAIIDLATLTGAMMVALGYAYCGVFANDDELWSKIDAAAKTSHEKMWRMPLDKDYREQVKSDIADIRNMAKHSKYAGSATAAAFLERFIDEGVKWAHFDIAGTAWLTFSRPTCPKGATGVGVRLLDTMIEQSFEKAKN